MGFSRELPLMEPSMISGVHVDIELDITCNSMSLTEALLTVAELKSHIDALPGVKSAHIRPLVELNGLLWEGSEPVTRGVLFKLQEDADGKR
jgi:hypothetical protein